MRRYFDHNATTPVHPAVKAALVAALEEFGNPSSLHEEGQRARAIVDRARASVAKALNSRRDEIYFTSGGTEACNWALLSGAQANAAGPGGTKPRRVLISAIEHAAIEAGAKALAAQGFVIETFTVNGDGVADLDDLKNKLRDPAALVALMAANNETGVVQPVAEAAALAHEVGALFFCDAVQALGKIPLDVRALGCDLLAISAHKIYGPKGTGALFVRKGLDLAPFHLGGGQEGRRRGGTESVPLIAALGAAAARVPELLVAQPRLGVLRDRLEQNLRAALPEMTVNGAEATRVANTASLSFSGVEGEALLINLDLEGFAVSTGAACSSGQLMPSHVLTAMGLAPERVRGSLRISLGESSDEAGVDALAAALGRIVPALRRALA